MANANRVFATDKMKTTLGKATPSPKRPRMISIWGEDLFYQEILGCSLRDALLKFFKQRCEPFGATKAVIAGNMMSVVWPQRTRSFTALELYQEPRGCS